MKAAIASLKVIDDLLMPPDVTWTLDMDMLDWLGGFFGFQTVLWQRTKGRATGQ